MSANSARRCSLLWLALFVFSGGAQATADGPDYYRVSGIASDAELLVRAAPGVNAAQVASLSPQAQCLRNLGCQGGLSLQEFSTLPPAARQQGEAENPRWCRIAFPGGSGWVEGRFLAEAACAEPEPQIVPISFSGKSGNRVIKGHLQGRHYVDYQLPAYAGQSLDIALSASNRQTYFNVTPPVLTQAMFVGSTSGDRFSRRLPSDGLHTIRLYLMPAAARRQETSRYSLRIRLSGKPLLALPARQDALIPGTRFHASATVSCAQDAPALSQQCEALVIRRSFAGDATLEVRWPSGALNSLRRILFIKGVPVSSDATEALSFSHDAEVTTIRIGDRESVAVPDALIFGG